MSILKNHNMAFFHTQGMSFKRWDETGILSRGVEILNIFASQFKNLYIFTYNGKGDLSYQRHFPPNVRIIVNDKEISSGRYVYQLSFRHRDLIRTCSILRTEQMQGSQAAIIARIINSRAKLIIRTGYQLSYFHQKARRQIPYLVSTLLEGAAYRFCQAALVTSKEAREYVLKRYKIDPNKIYVTPNYINTELFKPDDTAVKYSNRVIFVGRLSREKNLEKLIEALAGTGIALDIVGEGELRSRLKERARELHVELKIIGRVPNEKVPEILNRYQVLVQPSLYEGMPKTLLEAMSCGIACIASDVPGSREVIKHKETGIIAGETPEELRSSIVDLMADKVSQETLGKQARKFILENYSLNSQIGKELKIYEQLVRDN